MKKIFAQPELTVVNMKHNDIVTASDPILSGTYSGGTILAPGQRGVFDPDDSWANAGY